jgi:hypothetical protein
MKFFYFTQISNSPFQNWAFPDDVQDTLEPFLQLSAQYSMLHIQLPRNDAPNISVSVEEIRFEEYAKFDLLTSSPSYSRLVMEDIQREHEHDPCSQLPLRFEHSHYCISELSNHGFVAGYRLVKHDNDTSSPIPDERTSCLHYGLSFDNQPYCKSMNFIETKVAAMKLQGFNH